MDPAKLKVIELRGELQQRGLDTKGNKPILVERLRKALDEEQPANRPEEKIETEDTEDTKSTNPKLSPRTPSRASRSSNVPASPTKISTRSSPKASQPIVALTQLSIKSDHIHKLQDTKSPIITPTETDETEEIEEIEEDSLTSEPSVEKVEMTSDPLSLEASEEKEDPETTTDPLDLETSPEKDDVEIAKDQSNSTPSVEKEDAVEEGDVESTKDPLCSESNVEESLESPKDQSISTPSAEKDGEHTEDVSISEPSVNEEEEITEIEKQTTETTEMEEPELETNKDSLLESAIKEEPITVLDEPSEEDIPEKEEDDKPIPMDQESDVSLDTVKSEDTTMDMDNQENLDCVEEKEKPNDVKELEKSEPMNIARETRDRKRKRSPSPIEYIHKTLIPVKIEDEPDFDDSTVMLSWYDSDLNLVIDKTEFLSATPLHKEGFCYIWGGVRASHGFAVGKVYYEAKIIEECTINAPEEENPHVVRIGWSIRNTSMQLGESKFSYGYESNGKKCSNNEFIDYGKSFGRKDIVGCYLDSKESSIDLYFTVNGEEQGLAFTISKEEIGNEEALFPHVLSKNCQFVCNFGQDDPWSDNILNGYKKVGCVDPNDRTNGPRRPKTKEECEVVMMCGLPGAGKTVWANRYAQENPEKMFNILGTNHLIDKMKVMGVARKQCYQGRWEVLIDKCSKAVNKLMDIASGRRRNYILDQTNVYASAQKRKMKNFTGYQRTAIIVLPKNEEYEKRAKRETDHEVSDSVVLEMKANFSAPSIGDYFNDVRWTELPEEDGKKLIEKYNKEGKEAGFSHQQIFKRPRFEKNESSKSSRDSRSSSTTSSSRDYSNTSTTASRDTSHRDYRDNRDRWNNYQDRNRSSSWRGGSSSSSGGGGGWRNDRPPLRGAVQRHRTGGGYGGSSSGWRGGRGQSSYSHRSGDRRTGSGDRRTGNDRNRSSVPARQGGGGGWSSVGNYSAPQSSGSWVSHGSWSTHGQWGQSNYGSQDQWGGTGGGWKSYGSSSSSSYGGQQQQQQQQQHYQQGCGNGSWGGGYYNQYWDQQQEQTPSGQSMTTNNQAIGKP